MKRLLVLILALFIVFEANETTLGKGREKEEIVVEKVSFIKTYSLVREYEGYYNNDPHDRGGETYGGVARRFNQNWYGWRYVDQQKNKKRHDKIDQAEFWVQDYYLDIWVKEGWDKLTNQQVANYLFEFRINSPVGPKIIDKALNDCGFGIEIDNKIDEATINSIYIANPEVLLQNVQERRIRFYKSIARRDTTQKKWLGGWLKRAKKIV